MAANFKKLPSTLSTNGGHYKKVISQVYSSLSSIHSDVADLLATFLDSPKGRKLLSKINEKISNKILNEFICNIRFLHEKAPPYQKVQWLSLVCHLFTREELINNFGFKCSSNAFSHARKHAKTFYPGAPVLFSGRRPSISENLKEKVRNFFLSNSYLSSSETIKIRVKKGESQIIPVRICEHPFTVLFHLFLEENPDAKGKIKKSSFLSLRPPQVKNQRSSQTCVNFALKGGGHKIN